MAPDNSETSRRTLLKSVGTVAAAASIAGCSGGGGGGGGETTTTTTTTESSGGGGGETTTTTQEQQGPKSITALGGITGGSGYQQCLVFQQAVQNTYSDMRVTVSGTSGWKTDAKLMWQRGKAEFGIVPAGDLYGITHGEDPYTEENNYILMAFPGVPPSYFHVIVRKNSDMQTYKDLSGKTVNILSRGSSTAAMVPKILKAIGVSDVTYKHYPHQEASSQLAQGGIDAAAAAGIASQYGQMSQQNPVRVLSVSEGNQQKVKNALPALSMSTYDFGKNYNGAGKSTVPSSWILMAAQASLPDNFVYRMVKTVFDNIDVGKQIYEPFGTLKPEMAAETGMPVHPGAYKYYQEQGVEFSDDLKPPYDLPL